ncbi:MAG: hypothetical protein COT91_00500 [Candidatus Doudnabacteria bacterium CG10_big_fil_rev_8_21_14_0_10_41_10]|uniref:Type II secretion system protein n=1 Tax=Candidatus Doudnabacteria bacterium CG10_big_fil_rev_8_21_14_0_10_41_10 TaxID=1974551 RepID=A0A2H0VEU0_9BACT|nr:MAG: hypothetical protein COT91_00500 [Candidatus Doudnabacteria bacterium CG10_big_fil_rev_8_21_14_0_10_41_10]
MNRKQKNIIELFGKENGQTLIETLVAIFLLTTGIIGGLSLAIFALGASDVTVNQIVATNLAREGVEVVRNMRDTNWLEAEDADGLSDCSSDIGVGQECYADWDSQVYNISGNPSGKKYILQFSTYGNSWQILTSTGGQNVRLYLQSDGSYNHVDNGNWKYSRLVVITRESATRLLVKSTVWWKGKNCAATDSPPETRCKVVIEEYLTNWRNY